MKGGENDVIILFGLSKNHQFLKIIEFQKK